MQGRIQNELNILGTRGIPAAHGGFETFVAHFAPYLRDAGWRVAVYCQGEEGVSTPAAWTDEWQGMERRHFQTRMTGALATIEFDLRSIFDVLGRSGVDLVLGYNTAAFNVLQRLFGRKVAMNMDGIEWKRQKWGRVAKTWFWANEWVGCKTCTVAIADNPEIAAHLARRGGKGAIVIPYASQAIDEAATDAVANLGLAPEDYFISIARIEPENSILEIVKAFVQAETGRKFAVLGKLAPETNAYHAEVIAAANGDVRFIGAIYDPDIVRALRFHCLAYVHGHQVGGTNPSLVEALGAGNPVIAHDNPFNRWTTGGEQVYFDTIDGCVAAMRLLSDDATRRMELAAKSRKLHAARFRYEDVHGAYRRVLESMTETA